MGDAAVKLLSVDFTLWQIFVLRSLLALPLLLLGARIAGISLWPKAIGWTALRSILLALNWIAYYAALPHVDLAVAAATYYTLPLFITLLAALLLGDRIEPLGWVAICLGFAGVVMVLQPNPDDFNLAALLPLAAAFLFALAMILTRSKCRQETPLALSLALNLTFIVFGLAGTLAVLAIGPREGSFLGAAWGALTPAGWLALSLMALAILIGSIGAAIAYQNGPPATIAAFDFAYVGFATIWGLLIFAEQPSAIQLLGMAMIVGAGVLALRR